MLPIAVLFAGLASCTPEETPEPEIPNTTTTTPTAPQPPTPQVAGANGVMVAIEMDFSYTQMGISVPFNTEMGVAAFYNTAGSGTLVDAGTVKINNNALTNTNNAYLVTAGIPTQEPSTLGLDGNISWNVSGNSSNNMPADNFNIDHTVYPFPDYTGTIPTEITRANGLSLTFNNTTVTGSDSVYVMIVSGSTSLIRSFHKNAGSVMISSTDLNTLNASSTESPAYLEIVPWRVMGYTNPMGRIYAYVNEKAIVRSITLN